jgi:SAM-dependent methyltransferase
MAFKPPLPPLEEGIYRTLKARSRLPIAQRSNAWRLTARLYEPLWRWRSVGLLTRGGYSTQRELALMLAWTRPRPGEVFLDAGCASGLYSRTLLERVEGLQVHALDLSLVMLEAARARAEGVGLQPVLVQGDAADLPYEDAIFDGIVCGGSPNEFLDLPRVLAEFSRVLKPGGRLFMMYLSRAESRLGRSGQGIFRLTGLRFLEPKALEREAAQAGLKLRQAHYRERVALALFLKR